MLNKRLVTTLILATALFALAVALFLNRQQNLTRFYNEWQAGVQQQEALPQVELPPNAHPFAVALQEYFAGGMSLEDLRAHEERMQMTWARPTGAILVDIDSDGTQGMLAQRLINPDGPPVPVLRLFALYNGEVSYLDVGGLYAINMWITEEGRIIEAGHHWGSEWYTPFEVENGRLARSFTIHAMLNEYVDGTDNVYSYRPSGEPLENARTITQQEFEDIRARYGLNLTLSWWVTDDQTAQILAMTSTQLENIPVSAETPRRYAETAYKTPTLEELGETIVAAGNFWEEWWGSNPQITGRLWYFVVYIPQEQREIIPVDFSIYAKLSPLSGFASLNDIRCKRQNRQRPRACALGGVLGDQGIFLKTEEQSHAQQKTSNTPNFNGYAFYPCGLPTYRAGRQRSNLTAGNLHPNRTHPRPYTRKPAKWHGSLEGVGKLMKL